MQAQLGKVGGLLRLGCAVGMPEEQAEEQGYAVGKQGPGILVETGFRCRARPKGTRLGAYLGNSETPHARVMMIQSGIV